MITTTCPHCAVHFSSNVLVSRLGEDVDGEWMFEQTKCTRCNRSIVWLRGPDAATRRMVRPSGASRPLPDVVPDEYKAEFYEANETMTVSAAASAALSRRLLQRVLREHAQIKARNLDQEIQAVLDSNDLPTDLAEDLDAIRTTGNFAAHSTKSKSTGEIVEVEPGEAEWLLDVLEELFDFYFVRPAKRLAKRDAMNAKLEDVGKPALKTRAP